MTLPTGSGIERWMSCRASAVLHRAFDQGGNRYASVGLEAHAYLQRISLGMSAEASLDEVDDRHREACANIDLDDLKDVLGLTPEFSFAFDPGTDTARVIGSGLEREYEAAGVMPHEITLTVDVAGLDNPTKPTRGLVVDFKTGWGRITPAERNWQMRGGALALARTYDLDEVLVQLIYLRDGKPARRDRAVFTAADLAMFAGELAARRLLALDDQRLRTEHGTLPDATKGSWCGYCPSYHACPAQMGLIRGALGGAFDEPGPVDPAQLRSLWHRLEETKKPMKRIEQAIYAAAREHPVLIDTLPDGSEMWLGVTEVKSQSKIDGVKAREIVKEMLDAEAAEEVTAPAVTLGRIETAAKKRVPRGQGQKKIDAIRLELERRGALTRPTRHEVDFYKLAPRAIAAKAG